MEYLNKTGKSFEPGILYGISPEIIISEVKGIVLPYSFPVWNGTIEAMDEVRTLILRHYYFREIAMTPVAKWKWKLNTKLCEIMPYLNKMRTALDDMGSVFDNVNLTENLNINKSENEGTTGSGGSTEDVTGSDTNKQTNTGTTNTTGSRTTVGHNMHSDTPQDGLQDVIDGRYLSSADVTDGSENNTGKVEDTLSIDGNGTTSRNSTRTNNRKEDRLLTSEDIHVLQRHGFQGNRIEMVEQLAKARISWENMLIAGVGQLFFGVLHGEDDIIDIGGCYERKTGYTKWGC